MDYCDTQNGTRNSLSETWQDLCYYCRRHNITITDILQTYVLYAIDKSSRLEHSTHKQNDEVCNVCSIQSKAVDSIDKWIESMCIYE